MGISRFEDIQAWQAARELCKVVYELTGDEKFHRDFGLRDQARRAAVSIMANIAEGFDSPDSAGFYVWTNKPDSRERRDLAFFLFSRRRKPAWTLYSEPGGVVVLKTRKIGKRAMEPSRSV